MRAPTLQAALPPLAAALATALSLGACVNLAPSNERPAMPVPQALPASGAVSSAMGAQPMPPWRELMRDERLRRVVDKVLATNRDLRVALLTVERSRAQLQIADADRWPTLNAALTGSRAPNTSGVQTSTFQAGLQLSSFEIDLFDRVKNSSDAAAASLLATAAAARSARLSLLAQAVGAWITLAADEEQLSLAQRTLQTREQSESLSALRAKVGAASDLELRTVQTLTAQARATLAQLQRQRALDLQALNLLVGEPLPEADLPGPKALSETAWLAPVPVAADSTVLLSRPDVIAAEQSLYAANANIGAARAAFFPRIGLSGSVGQVSKDLSGLVNAGQSAWTLSASALMAIFDAGRVRAGVQVAKVNRDIAVAQYEKAVQTAFLEAANGLQGQAAWSQQVAAQQALLTADRERHRLTALRLKVGAAGLTDMLDAERSLASAEQALVQARLGESLNRLALYKALGGEEAGAERL